MSISLLQRLREPVFCRTARHEVLSGAVKRGFKVALTGDWHVSPIVSENQKEMLARVFEREKPDLIILQGDLIDEPEMLKDEKLRRQLVETVRVCTRVAPTIGVLGNHDLFYRLSDRKLKRTETPEERERRRCPEAVERMREVFREGGAQLLVDEWFEALGVKFFGFYGDMEKYRKIKTSEKTLSWFIGHAPFEEAEDLERLEKFRVASFGHTHGGCLPIGLDVLCDKVGFHGGLITPMSEPFPKDWTRGCKKYKDGRCVIFNSGMVATQFSAPRLAQYLNFLKRAEVTMVEIKLDSKA